MATLTDALRVFARSGKLIRFEAHADSGNVFLNLSEIRAPLNGGAQSPGNTSDIGNKSVAFDAPRGLGHPAVSVTKPCLVCGNQIMAKRSGSLYCSAKCKQAAYRQRLAA